jgi:hypothetical protein
MYIDALVAPSLVLKNLGVKPDASGLIPCIFHYDTRTLQSRHKVEDRTNQASRSRVPLH